MWEIALPVPLAPGCKIRIWCRRTASPRLPPPPHIPTAFRATVAFAFRHAFALRDSARPPRAFTRTARGDDFIALGIYTEPDGDDDGDDDGRNPVEVSI